MQNISFKKNDLYPLFSFLLQTLLPKCIKIMERKRISTQDVIRSRVDPGKGNSIIFWMTVPRKEKREYMQLYYNTYYNITIIIQYMS